MTLDKLKHLPSFILPSYQNSCVPKVVGDGTHFHRSANREEFDKIVDQLSAKPKARAVVLFVDEDGTR